MICKKCGKEIYDSECLYCKAEELTEKIKNSPDDAMSSMLLLLIKW